jgi:NADPH2:quinone reductase
VPLDLGIAEVDGGLPGLQEIVGADEVLPALGDRPFGVVVFVLSNSATNTGLLLILRHFAERSAAFQPPLLFISVAFRWRADCTSLCASVYLISRKGEQSMRAMRAKGFHGYGELELVNLPKPEVPNGRVLVRMTAAGVTPLDHTILSGQYPKATAPLVLGNEGAGVVEEGGGTEFPAGSRVMFTGLYGVLEDGTYSEYVAVRKQNLCLIPEGIDDVTAAGIPVAYLTAQMALSLVGFRPGKTVLAPAIGGSVGNAATQLARALGAKHAISSTTNHRKAVQAKALGFDEVIDLSGETLSAGVRRITDGYGADIVIDAIGGEILSEALSALAAGGAYTTLGYSAGRKATIDVTDLIWKRATMRGFALMAQPPAAWEEAWSTIVPLLQSGGIKPIVAKTFPLVEASEALRYLIEDRPFGRVVLTVARAN